MTYSEPAPIDPHRPWIDDPRDAPANMNWLQSLTNPFGETSRLHFTRAWTALFFIRFIYRVGLLVIMGVFAFASAPSFTVPVWIWPLIIIVTALMSAILHVRRLADARRSPLWAVLVLLPIISGFGGFIVGAGMGAGQYQAAVDARSALTRPAAAETDVPATAADGEAETPAARQGPQQGPQVNVTETSAREFAVQTGIGIATVFWAPVSFGVMLWSLLWVGRLPNGGGTIRERVANVDSATYGAS